MNEVATTTASPLDLILADPDKLKDLPVETVERLFAVQREARADIARSEFAIAFHQAQSEMTPVRKAARNSQTNSMYAKAEDVDDMLKPVLLENGITTSGSSEPCDLPDTVRFVLTVRHVGGHVEKHYMDAPIDNVGMKGSPTKTRLHGTGSAEAYALRRLKCSVFDIQLVADDDGNAAGGRGRSLEKIGPAQVDELNTLADEVRADKVAFCRYLKVDGLPSIPLNRFTEAMQALERKRVKS